MKICGLQKTTLIDYPGKIACTIFLYGCNFRCGFCYNAELVTEEAYSSFSEKEILIFLEQRKGKLDAVCITGGEPLLTLDKDFLIQIKSMGYLVKIDTNGTNPEKLEEYIEEELIDYVAMDIKNSKEKYDLTANVKVDISLIEKSIKVISQLKNYEFRTTIIRDLHTREDIRRIGKWLNELIKTKPKKYFLQGFKSEGNFIDKEFATKRNTQERYLKKLKKTAEIYFDLIEVRC